jgi:hypothetical protein
MRVRLMEGDAMYDPVFDQAFVVPGPEWQGPGTGPPNLISEAEYEEYTAAFGQVSNFDKTMHYHSTLPDWQMPEPWYTILP